jgi:2-dehydro-3-deoxyphosphogalactonate aldolase
MNEFAELLADLPLIAILRGIRPSQAAAVGEILIAAGFRAIEVPLNSPEPLASIRILAEHHAGQTVIGAGTVLDASALGQVATAGGRLIVMPHAPASLIRQADSLGLFCVPGVATPTEAFAALDSGADALKLFPAEALPPAVVKAWRAVLPPECWLLPVGGITPDNMAAYLAAGAKGFGLGGGLFRPGMALEAIAAAARRYVAAYRAAAAAI